MLKFMLPRLAKHEKTLIEWTKDVPTDMPPSDSVVGNFGAILRQNELFKKRGQKELAKPDLGYFYECCLQNAMREAEIITETCSSVLGPLISVKKDRPTSEYRTVLYNKDVTTLASFGGVSKDVDADMYFGQTDKEALEIYIGVQTSTRERYKHPDRDALVLRYRRGNKAVLCALVLWCEYPRWRLEEDGGEARQAKMMKTKQSKSEALSCLISPLCPQRFNNFFLRLKHGKGWKKA